MSKLISLSSAYPIADRPAVYVIHENEEWVKPLRIAFNQLQVPYVEWFVNEGQVDLSAVPPEGIFYNRMSASSHTRSHRYAVELTAPLVSWLEAHGKKVINNRRALQLEVRKFEQYLELQKCGVKTPQTIAASGKVQILSAAKKLNSTPFILKPNRGGKGQGVQLFRSIEELKKFLDNAGELSLDGISLVQEYICPTNDSITRVEFIDGKFYYAVRVDTADGFQLCPADSCQVGDAFCPAPGEDTRNKFELDLKFNDKKLIDRLEKFFANNGMKVAAAEFVENERGERFIYDININTNYNQKAEERAGNQKRGMYRIAEFLQKELQGLQVSASRFAI